MPLTRTGAVSRDPLSVTQVSVQLSQLSIPGFLYSQNPDTDPDTVYSYA